MGPKMSMQIMDSAFLLSMDYLSPLSHFIFLFFLSLFLLLSSLPFILFSSFSPFFLSVYFHYGTF